MSDPRSSRRSSQRRASSTPRTAARRPQPSPAAATSTATLDPPAAPELGADEPTASVPDAGPAPRRTRRGDRRTQPPRAPRHRLLLACTAVLALGLVGVLLLNTVISQGAFRQFELEVDLILLAEEEEALARAVQQAETPIEVEKRARALGMVPAAAPVFLRLSDGAVLGEPVPAPKPTAPVDFKGAPGLQPTPKPRLAGTTADPEPSESDTDPAAGTGVDPATGTTGADPATGTTGVDPALDPATGVDPALDPATGLEDPRTDGEPAVSPSPTPQVNP